jgi:N-methylhydantoinase A
MAMKIAIDTGGTFTDLMVSDDQGSVQMFKAPTTPDDPVRGLVDSLRLAADGSNLPLAEFLAGVDVLVHGTTHAINAIVTKRTARTALLATQGHPDTLVFREGGRIEPFNFTVAYPEPYIPKELTFEIEERILADGSIHRALNEPQAMEVLGSLRHKGVEAVAVCLLWSIINPEHELALGRLIERHLPGVPYTLSHQVNPSLREFRRASSTAIDASLKPIMGHYMGGLAGRLADLGFAGRLLIVTSQGGVMDASDVARAPVHLINSGPSMAPVAARRYGAELASDTLIVGDTGGTTFDVSLVHNGRIPKTRETWLGQPFRSIMTGMPSVDVKSVGAGGGSLASVDSGGLLRVGPMSAGAVPGPACYGRGGEQPTVTDAAVMLGYIDPTFFLGGGMELDLAASERALSSHVASNLSLTVEEAAAAVIELATEHMVQAILEITVNQGIDPASATFVAGGGAAGLNCVAIGRRLGCKYVLVPETGATLSAAGGLMSDLTAHFQKVQYAHSDAFPFENIGRCLKDLSTRCDTFAKGPGQGASEISIDWSVEARYPDQAWEIEVPLQGGFIQDAANVADIVAAFHRVHEETFAVSDERSPVEMISWGAEIRCRTISDSASYTLSHVKKHGALSPRKAYFRDRGWVEVSVLRFENLEPNEKIIGPAIIESAFTSIVLDAGSIARLDENNSLLIEV